MRSSTASVAIHYVRLLTDYCGRLGVSGESLFRAVDLDPCLLQDRDARIEYRCFQQIMDYGAQWLNDPCLGLHIGITVQPGYYGPYGFAVMTCKNTAEVLSLSARYSALVCNAYRCEYVRRGNESIRLWRSTLPARTNLGRIHEQLNLSAWLTMARWVTARPELSPTWITFRHSPPQTSHKEYQALFRCRVDFEAPETALGFDAELLNLPLTQADERVRRMMQAVCDRLEQLHGDLREPDWLRTCQQAIQDSFKQGEPKPSQIAAACNMSVEQLRWQLAKRGTTFRQLVNRLRRDLALSYLHDPGFGLIDIACLTGFSEQSAFNRAFKRWTDMTPGEYRKQRLGFSDTTTR